MSASERNFNNFYLGDNVYELAGGVIPELAERLDVKLSGEPNSEEMHGLVGAIGKNKVLRNNAEITAIDRDTQIELVEHSGIQLPLERSLWSVEIKPTDNDIKIDSIVMTGGVVNWMNRSAHAIGGFVSDNPKVRPEIIIATGERKMDSASETGNPRVKEFLSGYGYLPDESDYAQYYLTGDLSTLRLPVSHLTYNTSSGDEIAMSLFKERPDLLDKKILFARVANAGIQLAVQMRKAAREYDPFFDQFNTNAQAFVLTDEFPLARDEQQEADPRHYQKAGTALRQLGLTAKMLHEAADGE